MICKPSRVLPFVLSVYGLLIVCIALLAAAGASAGPPTAGATSSATPANATTTHQIEDATAPLTFTGRIAFVRPAPTYMGIVTMNEDGSGVQTVAALDGTTYNEPAWSPDSLHFAYEYLINTTFGSQIGVMQAGGGERP